jgi:hypothetical protein
MQQSDLMRCLSNTGLDGLVRGRFVLAGAPGPERDEVEGVRLEVCLVGDGIAANGSRAPSALVQTTEALELAGLDRERPNNGVRPGTALLGRPRFLNRKDADAEH